MKFFDQLDKRNRNFLICGMILIISFFTLVNLNAIVHQLNRIIDVCFPFIMGFIIAFFLNPLVKFFEYNIYGKTNWKEGTKHTWSCISALILSILVVLGLAAIIIPQFANSLTQLASKSSQYLESFSLFIDNIVAKYDLPVNSQKLVGSSSDVFDAIVKTLGQANFIPQVAQMSIGIFKSVFAIFVGLIAGLYLMIDRDRFMGNLKKVTYTLFSKRQANYLHYICLTTRDVFYDFVIGKAIDSLIIGVICYIGLSLLNIEYAGLLSIIVGTTNMIPVFGPFIGAVPGIFILLIINPFQALIFTIFILLLQQVDGNVIGPIILGDKLGLPSFWILFAVTVGGAFFGIIGMFFGVPIFAVIYKLFSKYINARQKVDFEDC